MNLKSLKFYRQIWKRVFWPWGSGCPRRGRGSPKIIFLVTQAQAPKHTNECTDGCTKMSSFFLSAMEYIPTRTIIQPGCVSSSSLSSSLSAFSRWDNSRTLWAIELIFCMDTCHDHVLWIRIREPISLMHTGPTSQISIFLKKFQNGITWSNFVRFG